MAGKKGSQMTGNGDRTHPWSAAPVGNAKRLVQIQMTDIRADVAGPTNPNLRIHIRAIHIDLAAVGMNDLANAPDIGLEYPVGGWVGQHQGPSNRHCLVHRRPRARPSSRPWPRWLDWFHEPRRG